MLPNLFIVGQPKAGTTSLVQHLSQHEDIFLPSVKEPHFMCRKEGSDWYYYKQPLIYNRKKYEALYSNAADVKFRIDATVHYLRFESAAYEIKKNAPNAKVIIVIREPVARILSHYLMDRRGGFVTLDLMSILKSNSIQKSEYIECSMASNQIELYLKLFGESNVLILDFSEYVTNNQKSLNQILCFLDVEKMEFKIESVNTYRDPKPFIKWLYTVRRVKKIYAKILPSKIRTFLRQYLHSFEKPTFKPDETLAELVMVKKDYQEVKKLFKNKARK
jgi:hypothetical protein